MSNATQLELQRVEAAVEALYAWLASIYADLARRGVRSCTVSEIVAASVG